jgi:hypothetical protein
MAQDESTPVARAVAGRVLQFDVPGLEIGVAAYPEIPTGCTVFNFDVATFPDGVMLELDVRGGAPWHSGAEDIVNAISLAGGSVYGLEAAAGVSAELFAQAGTAIWSPSLEPSFTTSPWSRSLTASAARGSIRTKRSARKRCERRSQGASRWGTREQAAALTSASGRTGPMRASGAGRAAPSARSVRSTLRCSPSSMPSA